MNSSYRTLWRILVAVFIYERFAPIDWVFICGSLAIYPPFHHGAVVTVCCF